MLSPHPIKFLERLCMPQLIAVSFQMIWMHVIFGFFATPDVLSFSVEHMKLIIIIKNPALRETPHECAPD